MQAYLALVIAFGYLGCTMGLQCWTCRNANSLESCDRNGRLENCQYNELACETTYRRSEHTRVTVTKRCKQPHACMVNQMQNDRPSGSSTQCNTDQPNSVCRCCCQHDSCNVGGLNCASTTGDEVCSAVEPALHRTTECTRGNSSGSICSFKCNAPGYSLHPPANARSECRKSGAWSKPAPCCARQCPPYLLFDSVILFHANEIKNTGAMMMLAEFFLQEITLGQDSIRMAGAYFSGEPMFTSRIRFNDYIDAESLRRLVIERLQNPINTEDNMVNMTAALEFSMQHLLTTEAGMRGPEVPKKISILTNQNPRDDPVEYARKIRTDPDMPVQILMLGFQGDEQELDYDKMVEITGNPDNVFIFENDPTKLNSDSIKEVFSLLCENPCRHVLNAP